MSRTDPDADRCEERPALRRADQAVVAVVVLVALTAVTGYWLGHGGHRGQLIEIDRAEPKTIDFVVDVNTADWPELAQLPGIGETLARRIVEARSTGGPFVNCEDMQRRVRGIGPAMIERIRPYLKPVPPAGIVAGE